MAVVPRSVIILSLFLAVTADEAIDNITTRTTEKIALDNESTVILREIINIKQIRLHELEDLYLINVRSLELKILNHTRLIEATYNSASRDIDIQELFEGQTERIKTAIRILEDEFWTFKTHEPQFRSELREINDAIKTFSKSVINEIRVKQTPVTTTTESPTTTGNILYYDGYNYYDRSPITTTDRTPVTETSTEYLTQTMWTNSRKLKDQIERIVRTLQENLQKKSQQFQDSSTRFVRQLEDNALVATKGLLSSPEDNLNSQFRYVIKQIYALRTKINTQLTVFLQSIDSQLTQLEEALELQVSKLLETADLLEESRRLLR